MMATDIYGNEVTLQTCDLCDKQGCAEGDFIALVFNGFNICEVCKTDLEKLIIVEKRETCDDTDILRSTQCDHDWDSVNDMKNFVRITTCLICDKVKDSD